MRFQRAASYLLLVLVAFGAGSAAADDRDDVSVLALGDSVAFGYITQAGHQYVNAANFIGYPEHLSGLLRVNAVNAACPGETSGSLISATAPDNGCRAFRAAFPLHVAYGSTQLAFATAYLRHHREVRLVTLAIGANDLFLLEDACANDPTCIAAGLPAALATIEQNVGAILAALRGAGFGGEIIVVNYYSLDYSDLAGTETTALLNQAETAAAKAFGAVVADVFTAFKKVASNPLVGGKTCNAGLLNVDPADQALCDVHPAQTGQRLMALTVARVHRPWSW